MSSGEKASEPLSISRGVAHTEGYSKILFYFNISRLFGAR